MARARIEVKTVELLQLLYALQRCLIEGALAIEGVENDALEEIAEREVVILSESLQYFQQALFNANPGLYPLDNESLVICHVYQCTRVTTAVQEKGEAYNFRLPH